MCRVLKGWQEEADPGREKRTWRWLLEGDTDDSGYDHAGEPACLVGLSPRRRGTRQHRRR